jgi:hypothetical protein
MANDDVFGSDKDYRGEIKRMQPKPPAHTGMATGTTNRGMRSGSSFQTPKPFDYMGYAFDAAVRRGKDAARMALKTKISNLDAGQQKVLLAQFDDSIGKQESLHKDTGLGEGAEYAYRDKDKVKGMTPEKAKAYGQSIIKSKSDFARGAQIRANVGKAISGAVGKAASVMGRQENIPF